MNSGVYYGKKELLNLSQRSFLMKQDGKTLELLKQFEKLGIPSIDCVVYHKGKCVFRYMSGYSDEAHQRPVNGKERYNIYSCSKVITCTAALQLVENDTIRLEDAVYEYLPEFRHMKKTVDGKLEDVNNVMTIRHLFAMTAGLTYKYRLRKHQTRTTGNRRENADEGSHEISGVRSADLRAGIQLELQSLP